MMWKNNSGFTLVELLVAIAASALVVGVAMSFLLFGMKMEKSASDNAGVQSDSRVIMRTLENIAGSGEIGEIRTYYTGESPVLWELWSADGTEVVLSFNLEEKTINGVDDAVIIEDVEYAELEYDNNLLKCTIKTTSGKEYTSSVYCRIGIKDTPLEVNVEEGENVSLETEQVLQSDLAQAAMSAGEASARYSFVLNVIDQYGSTGKIYEPGSIYDGLYYSQWYNLPWGKDTPWCAIFLSWAFEKTALENSWTISGRLGSLVDDIMWFQFLRGGEDYSGVPDSSYEEWKEDYAVYGSWEYSRYLDKDNKPLLYEPSPGDLVFFERGDDNKRADHIGVALYISTDDEGRQTLFVLEGNNNNRVGVFAYTYNDDILDEDNAVVGTYANEEMYVIGYGIVDWERIAPEA